MKKSNKYIENVPSIWFIIKLCVGYLLQWQAPTLVGHQVAGSAAAQCTPRFWIGILPCTKETMEKELQLTASEIMRSRQLGTVDSHPCNARSMSPWMSLYSMSSAGKAETAPITRRTIWKTYLGRLKSGMVYHWAKVNLTRFLPTVYCQSAQI